MNKKELKGRFLSEGVLYQLYVCYYVYYLLFAVVIFFTGIMFVSISDAVILTSSFYMAPFLLGLAMIVTHIYASFKGRTSLLKPKETLTLDATNRGLIATDTSGNEKHISVSSIQRVSFFKTYLSRDSFTFYVETNSESLSLQLDGYFGKDAEQIISFCKESGTQECLRSELFSNDKKIIALLVIVIVVFSYVLPYFFLSFYL